MPAFLVYGTFMRGQPGHANLEGARFEEPVETAPGYRLWEVDGRWPALIEDDDGVTIAAELYEIGDQKRAPQPRTRFLRKKKVFAGRSARRRIR